jgi:acetyl-CoA carboxylase biotin carboxyl carrier protein
VNSGDEVFKVNSKDLKQLMEYISESNFVEFELEQENLKLKLVKEGAVQPATPPTPGIYPMPYLSPAAAPTVPVAGPAAPATAATPEEEGVYQVTSPMVGTYYRSPNPSADPYVEVGTVVKKGQVLCIIEAMKLMNEIESEVAGEILEIPADNGQPVEYGEVLFRIRMTS